VFLRIPGSWPPPHPFFGASTLRWAPEWEAKHHPDGGIVALKGFEKQVVVVVLSQQTILRRKIRRRQHGSMFAASPETFGSGARFRRLHRRTGAHRLSGEIILLLNLGQ
jgi:hypothetical protein